MPEPFLPNCLCIWQISKETAPHPAEYHSLSETTWTTHCATLLNAFFRRVKRFGYIDTVLTVDELLSQSMICLRPVSQATLYIVCFPLIIVVTYVNVDVHSTCLIMTLYCALSIQICRIWLLICFYLLFCVLPVCYDVRLSHLNKDCLLTYLLKFIYKYRWSNRISTSLVLLQLIHYPVFVVCRLHLTLYSLNMVDHIFVRVNGLFFNS